MNKRKTGHQQKGSRKSSKKWCELCKCWVSQASYSSNSVSSWEQHVNGIKHRRKIVSQKYWENDSGLVVSIFENKPSVNYTTNDPAYSGLTCQQEECQQDESLLEVLKQFKMELVHHVGVASSAYQNALSKMEVESVSKVKMVMQQEIPLTMRSGKGPPQKQMQNSYYQIEDQRVSMNIRKVDDALDVDAGDIISKACYRENNINSCKSIVKEGEFLEWNERLNCVQLVSLASMATDLDVYQMCVPIECSTDANKNAANQAAVSLLIRNLAKNMHIRKLILRYVVDAGEIAQYAGRKGLQYNGQHRIALELLNFSRQNSTIQHLQINIPPGGFGWKSMEQLGQVHQTLLQTANAKTEMLQSLFKCKNSMLGILPEQLNYKILAMANLTQEQISKRSFNMEVEYPL